MKVLKLILFPSKSIQFITPKRFSWVISLYGPFDTFFADRALNVFQHRWYYGSIPKNICEKELMLNSIPSFVVREGSVEGTFTISYKMKNKINNSRIIYKTSDQKFYVSETSYEDLNDAIFYFSQKFSLKPLIHMKNSKDYTLNSK